MTRGSTSSRAARSRRGSASTSSGSRRARATPGTRTRSGRRARHRGRRAGSRPAAATVSRSGRATRSTRPPASGTGTARRPDRFMTHLAIWEAPADGPETEWGAQVTDDEYLATPGGGGPMTAWTADELDRIGRRRRVRGSRRGVPTAASGRTSRSGRSASATTSTSGPRTAGTTRGSSARFTPARGGSRRAASSATSRSRQPARPDGRVARRLPREVRPLRAVDRRHGRLAGSGPFDAPARAPLASDREAWPSAR